MPRIPSCHGKKMRAVGHEPSRRYVPDHFWNLGESSWTTPKTVYHCDKCGKTERMSSNW